TTASCRTRRCCTRRRGSRVPPSSSRSPSAWERSLRTLRSSTASTSRSCWARTSRPRSPSTQRPRPPRPWPRPRRRRLRRRAPLAEKVTETTVEQWAKRAALAAVDKKADDPVVLFVGDVLAITDYFVIVSGANSRQVRTIAEAVEEELTRDGGPKPL